MNYLMYIAMVLAGLAAYAEAYFDASKKGKIEHGLSASIRLIVSCLISYFLVEEVLYQILFSAILLNVYWIVFDPSYNMFRGVDWKYIGSTAKLDKLAKKYFKNGASYIYMKIWLLSLLSIPFLL